MTHLPTLDAMGGNPPVQVVSKHTFIDLVHARVKRHISDSELVPLRSNCGSLKARDDIPIPYWPYWLGLYQPNDQALRYLDRLFGDDLLINRIESTVDLVTTDEASAKILKRYVDSYLVQKYRRSRQVGGYDDTSYWRDKRWVNRQPVAYIPPDGSKVAHGQPCARAEIRVCGARAVRSIGVERPTDLIGYDHNGLWHRATKLVAVDLAGLGRAQRYANGDKRRCQPDLDLDAQTGASLALAARQFDDNGDPRRDDITMQEIIDAYRGVYDLRTAMVLLDNQWFLPEQIE